MMVTLVRSRLPSTSVAEGTTITGVSSKVVTYWSIAIGAELTVTEPAKVMESILPP